MKRRWKEIAISGTMLAVIGFTISLLASPPEQWKTSIEGWKKAVGPAGGYVLILIAGLLVGFWARTFLKPVDRGVQLLDDKEYRDQFRKCLAEGKFTLVKVFGYTGEVVMTDLIEYNDRYKGDLEVRLLQRDWLIEKHDEEMHNQRPENHELRKWDKSRAIRAMAHQEWPHSMKRIIRYYSHQPILRGAMLSAQDSEESVAFIGLIRWEPAPTRGGSVFKSVPGHVLMVPSSLGRAAKDIIDRLNTQFEYDWRHGSTAAEVTARETGAGAAVVAPSDNVVLTPAPGRAATVKEPTASSAATGSEPAESSGNPSAADESGPRAIT